MNDTNQVKTLLSLATVLAIAGCATKRPVPVTSTVTSTNSFINTPEWSELKEPVENLVRAGFTNNCDAKIVLTKVEGSCADVRVIEIHPVRNTQ